MIKYPHIHRVHPQYRRMFELIHNIGRSSDDSLTVYLLTEIDENKVFPDGSTHHWLRHVAIPEF